MTIQKYLCSGKNIKETVLQSKYLMILHLIVLFLASSFTSITIYNEFTGNMAESAHRVWTRIEESLSLASAVGMVMATVVGVVTAYFMFSFLFGKRSVIFYHSMPYKRSSIFISRYISGIITIVIPLVIAFIINTIIYIYFKSSPPVAKGELFAYSTMVRGFLLTLLQYILVFSVGAFAASISGNIIAMAGISAFVFLVTPLTCSIIQACVNEWYITYNLSIDMDAFKMFPPLLCVDFLRNGVSVGMIVYSVAFALVFAVAGLVLYIYRKSENTNKFFAYNIVGTVLKYYITTFITLGLGLVFLTASGNSAAVAFIGYILVSFLAFAVIQAVFEMNFKTMFKNMKSYTIYALILIVVLSIPTLDIFGLDKKLPDRETIHTVEVTKLVNANRPQDYGNSLAKLKESKNIDAVYDFMEKSIDYTHQMEETKTYPQDSLVMNVKVNGGGIFNINRHLRYTKTDDRDMLLKALYQTAEYRAQLVADLESASWLNISKGYINTSTDTLSKTIQAKIIETLKKDIMSFSYEDTKNGSMFAEMYLNYAEDDAKTIYMQRHIPIMSYYTDTVALVSNVLGLDEWKNKTQMAFITETGQKIVDREEINEIIDRCASGGIEVRLYTSEYDYVCTWIEESNLPDFVKRANDNGNEFDKYYIP